MLRPWWASPGVSLTSVPRKFSGSITEAVLLDRVHRVPQWLGFRVRRVPSGSLGQVGSRTQVTDSTVRVERVGWTGTVRLPRPCVPLLI